jgi:hypothetical protein
MQSIDTGNRFRSDGPRWGTADSFSERKLALKMDTVNSTKLKQDEEIAVQIMMKLNSGMMETLKVDFVAGNDALDITQFVGLLLKYLKPPKDHESQMARNLCELFR